MTDAMDNSVLPHDLTPKDIDALYGDSKKIDFQSFAL